MDGCLQNIPTLRRLIQSSNPSTSWLKGYEPRMDDDFLLRFLIVDKNNLENAFKRYKSYYVTVLKIPKVESIIDADYSWLLAINDEIAESNCFQFHGFDKKNRAILSFISANLNPDFISHVSAVVLACLAFFEYFYCTFEQTKYNGIIWVVDHRGFSMSHFKLLAFNREFHTLHGRLWSGTVPISIESIWICNEGRMIRTLFKIFKPFISSKIMNRVNMVGNCYQKIIQDLGGPAYTPAFISGGTKNQEAKISQDVFIRHLTNSLPQKISK